MLAFVQRDIVCQVGCIDRLAVDTLNRCIPEKCYLVCIEVVLELYVLRCQRCLYTCIYRHHSLRTVALVVAYHYDNLVLSVLYSNFNVYIVARHGLARRYYCAVCCNSVRQFAAQLAAVVCLRRSRERHNTCCRLTLELSRKVLHGSRGSVVCLRCCDIHIYENGIFRRVDNLRSRTRCGVHFIDGSLLCGIDNIPVEFSRLRVECHRHRQRRRDAYASVAYGHGSA